MLSMRDKIYKLLNELDDLLLVFNVDSPQVIDLIQEVRRELERSRDSEDITPASVSEMPQVPPESNHFATVYSDDVLSDRLKDKKSKAVLKEILSAIWRKHAGKRYHMRWSDEGEMELVIDDAVGVRMERMQDGIRVRLMPYIKK